MAKRKSPFLRWRIRLNGLHWVIKTGVGLAVGLAALLGVVWPIILRAGDWVNDANDYAKRPWVVIEVEQRLVPIQAGVGNVNALVLIKWWGENRRGILALEGKRQRGVLTANDLRELNDLYNERDMLQREFQKAKLPVPSTP